MTGKRLILINGTMGVGKTTVCRCIQKLLPGNVFLDGDWCWDMNPFQVTEETKAMVMDNITHLLNNFLSCQAYENVIFCWVIHQPEILDQILSRLTGQYTLAAFTLTCAPEALADRLQKDVDGGRRSPGVIGRSLPRLPLYDAMDTVKIDVTSRSAMEAAGEIISRLPL